MKVLLLGHGNSRNEKDEPVLEMAQSLKAHFPDLEVAFWKSEPRLQDILPQMGEGEINILLYFAAHGYLSKVLIPDELRQIKLPGQKLRLYPPLGEHPSIPELILQSAKKAGKPENSALILLGHGSRKGSKEGAEKIAAKLKTEFAEIHCLFLEEEPKAENWQNIVQASKVMVQPLLMTKGKHLQEDIKEIFGGDKVILSNYSNAYPHPNLPPERGKEQRTSSQEDHLVTVHVEDKALGEFSALCGSADSGSGIVTPPADTPPTYVHGGLPNQLGQGLADPDTNISLTETMHNTNYVADIHILPLLSELPGLNDIAVAILREKCYLQID